MKLCPIEYNSDIRVNMAPRDCPVVCGDARQLGTWSRFGEMREAKSRLKARVTGRAASALHISFDMAD